MTSKAQKKKRFIQKPSNTYTMKTEKRLTMLNQKVVTVA